MEYPTSSPNFTLIYSQTLFATLIAATLLGWVQPILPLLWKPASYKYCVICVVLPLPVYPIIMSILLLIQAWISYFLYWKIGRLSFCYLIVRLLVLKYFLGSDFCGVTSSRSLLRSLTSFLFCCYLIYLLYFAYCNAFIAYLFKVPSGFLITLTGDKFIPVFVVWPVKNGGSLSLTYILISSIS